MKTFGDVVAASVFVDFLSLHDIGVLLGDAPGYVGGACTARLRAAAAEGKLEVKDGLVSRDALARYLTASGTQLDRGGSAMNWARSAVARAGYSTASLVEFAANQRILTANDKLVTFSASVKAGAAPSKSGAVRTFSGVAYGGGIVTDHPSLGPVAFDIGSMKFETPAPLLYDHDQPIGVITRASLASSVVIDGSVFADLEGKAADIAAMADRGLPWQLSVGIWRARDDFIAPGKSAVLNGKQMQGPLTVFRNSRVREVSIVALGADGTTKVQLH